MSDELKNNNPASEVPKEVTPANYIPMSSATLRLQVPARDGYHRHWFRGTPERIGRAKQAGYTFVDKKDVKINNFDLGGDANNSGDSDLGSHVSVISGDDVGANGQPGRMYLMECPNHLFKKSMDVTQEANDNIANAITAGMDGAGHAGETGQDAANRYVKGKAPDLFRRKS